MTKTLLLVLLTISTGLFSCKKEGCISSYASNYDSEAKTDDGSCSFQGNFYTSINSSSKTHLVNDGINAVEVYVNNSYVGVINITAYSPNSSHSCTSSNVASSTLSWTGEQTKIYTIDYRDQSTGFSIASSQVTSSPNQCVYAYLNY